jgi:hypothetical protein
MTPTPIATASPVTGANSFVLCGSGLTGSAIAPQLIKLHQFSQSKYKRPLPLTTSLGKSHMISKWSNTPFDSIIRLVNLFPLSSFSV